MYDNNRSKLRDMQGVLLSGLGLKYLRGDANLLTTI